MKKNKAEEDAGNGFSLFVFIYLVSIAYVFLYQTPRDCTNGAYTNPPINITGYSNPPTYTMNCVEGQRPVWVITLKIILSPTIMIIDILNNISKTSFTI